MTEGTERTAAVITPRRLELAQKENPFIKISEAVYNILEEAILASELKPGSKLRINKIAEDLHVSGTPVREAVEQLVTNGLVVESRGAGGKYKNYAVFDIADDDIAALFDMRKAMESTAAYLCAQKNWYVDMAELEDTLEKFRGAVRDYIEGDRILRASELDRHFHTLIINSTRNKYLTDMYATLDKSLNYLSVRTCEFMAATPTRDNLMMLATQHEAVVHAIKMSFPDLARRAMDDHIDFCAASCLRNRYFSENGK